MNVSRLTGLIAAPFTAFHADGSLHLDCVGRQAEALVASGVSGVFICGTTGEGLSLTTAERMALAERWVADAPRDLRVLVHVGHHALGECQRLARHAQEIGAGGFATLAPGFFKPAGMAELVDFCVPVAAAAPELPFYYYQIPSMTGVSLPCADFLAAARGRIPNLAGVKFTYENLMDYLACVGLEGGRFDICFGRDELLLAGLALGAVGAIGSTYNYMAAGYLRLIENFRRGDLDGARAGQARANAVIEVMVRHGGLAAGKAIMSLIGLDCGPVRSPLRPLSASAVAALRRDLEALAFFETALPALV